MKRREQTVSHNITALPKSRKWTDGREEPCRQAMGQTEPGQIFHGLDQDCQVQ